MFSLKRLVAIGLLAVGTSLSAHARCQSIEACAASYTDGQLRQMQGRLLESVEKFQSCAAPACPEEIRVECANSMLAVKEVVPSIVIAVRRGDDDILDALVSIDGARTHTRLDGRPTELDPGPHVVTVHVAGEGPLERQLVLRQGERNRLVSITLPVKPPPKLPTTGLTHVASPAQPSAAAQPESKAASRALGPALLAAGVGLASAGSFVGFALAGRSKEAQLEGCKPRCTRDQVDLMRERYLVADISLGISVLSFGTAVWLWWPPAAEPKAGTLKAEVVFDPSGRFSITALGRF